MQDPDPPQEQYPTARSDALRDRPIAPSSLSSDEEITAELRREDVRDRREKRKGRAWKRRCFIILVLIVAVVALGSSAAVIFGREAEDTRLVLAALAPLSGAAAATAFLARAYWASAVAGE